VALGQQPQIQRAKIAVIADPKKTHVASFRLLL
jgi:hypothetical protein